MLEGDGRDYPGLWVVQKGIRAVAGEPDDPENTMLVALTQRDLATIVFTVCFCVRAFPETARATESLMKKLIEISAATGFAPWTAEQKEDIFGGEDV